MAYTRVIVKGAFSGVETWSSGANYSFFASVFGGFNQTQCESIVQRLITNIPLASWPTNLRNLLSTGGSITGWRVETHQEDESISAVAENNYGTAVAGLTGGTKSLQDAVVISLRTATPGARGRGRMYWPALGASLGVGFKVASPTPAAIATDAKALLKLIGDQLNAELAANSIVATVELAVRSQVAHHNNPVIRLQVGDVLDTQRRRRDALVEAYAVTTYP